MIVTLENVGRNRSVPEMSHAGEYHGNTMLIGGLDDFLVPDAAARLDDGGYAGFGRRIDTVPEGKKGIRSQYCPFGWQQGFLDGYAGGIDPRHLAGTDADSLVAAGKYDGIGLDVLADPPSEIKRLVLGCGGCAMRHDLAVNCQDHAQIPPLDQQAAGNLLQVVSAGTVL